MSYANSRSILDEPKWRCKYVWRDGFLEQFDIIPTKAYAKSWLNHGKNLTSVVKILIIDDEGNILYDVKKQDPYGSPSKKNGKSKDAEEK